MQVRPVLRRAPPRDALPAIALGVAALATLAVLVRTGPLALDQSIAAAAGIARDSPLVAGLDSVASLSTWSALVLFATVLLWRAALWRAGLLMLSSLTTEVATAAVKWLVDGPRPVGADVSDLLATASFPSGHMARAIVGLGLLSVLIGRLRPALRWPSFTLATIFIVALGIARVASGDHYASDVLGGMLLGAVWLRTILLVDALVRWPRA
jgi:membrane-associated phospholipid phosphatase